MGSIRFTIPMSLYKFAFVCLALTNILNKVYSERSCLTCVLNNKETKALGYSNEK